MSHWIGVASRDHVLRAVEGGFAQVAHGNRAPLERMAPGHWIAYYSPRMQLGEAEPCRAFTALGAAPLEALRGTSSFLSDARSRGLVFRRGLFRVGEDDFRAIATAMGATI